MNKVEKTIVVVLGVGLALGLSIGFVWLGLVASQLLFKWPQNTDFKTVGLVWVLLFVVQQIVRGFTQRSKA